MMVMTITCFGAVERSTSILLSVLVLYDVVGHQANSRYEITDLWTSYRKEKVQYGQCGGLVRSSLFKQINQQFAGSAATPCGFDRPAMQEMRS
jgi:hypothetical protein